MVLLFYIPIVFVTIASVLYYYFTYNLHYWKKRGVPGPEPIKIFGNLKESILCRRNKGDVFKDLYDAFPNEKFVGIFNMVTPGLLIRDLDIIKNIMIRDFDAFTDRGLEFSKKGLGANLFQADGNTWRVLRNRFTPIFTSGKLKNMLYLMEERGDSFVNYVKSVCERNQVIEVHNLVQKYTMATIGACAFGLDLDTQYDTHTIKTLEKMDKSILAAKTISAVIMTFPNVLKTLNVELLPSLVTNFFNKLVKDVVTARNGVASSRNDFMDLILELKQKGEIKGTKRNADDEELTLEITEDVIAAQAFVFYVAGYETSATTMAFMLYELAKNPEIQDKLIAHIDSVVEKHNGKITYEALKDMTYMENVFDETLRMYPLAEPLQRNAKVDYKVPGTDLTIPKGTSVFVSAYGIQRDEKYFPEPEKFIPERHTVENSAGRHACAYMPFGVGPRNCIGMRFAKVQSRMCMTKFFSNFRVEVCKETQQVMAMDPKRVIMGPKGGIKLKLVKRN